MGLRRRLRPQRGAAVLHPHPRPENARDRKRLCSSSRDLQRRKLPSPIRITSPGPRPDDAGHSRKRNRLHLRLPHHQAEGNPSSTAASEVRPKVPPGQKACGPASGPSASIMSTSAGPPTAEIDIMEFLGREPDAVHGTVHFRKDAKPAESGKELTKQNPTDGFHIYAVEWSPDEISVFLRRSRSITPSPSRTPTTPPAIPSAAPTTCIPQPSPSAASGAALWTTPRYPHNSRSITSASIARPPRRSRRSRSRRTPALQANAHHERRWKDSPDF